VYEFLGVDPGFLPEMREVNPTRERRSPGLHAAMKRVLAAPARAVLPLGLRVRLAAWLDRVSSRPAPRAELPDRVRNRLREELREDVTWLSERLDQDLVRRWWEPA
jgi:hypothetical protein